VLLQEPLHFLFAAALLAGAFFAGLAAFFGVTFFGVVFLGVVFLGVAGLAAGFLTAFFGHFFTALFTVFTGVLAAGLTALTLFFATFVSGLALGAVLVILKEPEAPDPVAWVSFVSHQFIHRGDAATPDLHHVDAFGGQRLLDAGERDPFSFLGFGHGFGNQLLEGWSHGAGHLLR